MLWVGISVAVGRGDPTWHDGEETWATALGQLTNWHDRGTPRLIAAAPV